MKQNDKNSLSPSRVTFENSNRANQISAAPVRIKAPAKKQPHEYNNDLVYDSSRARVAAASDAAYFSNEAAKTAYTPAQAAYCSARAAGKDISAAMDAAAALHTSPAPVELPPLPVQNNFCFKFYIPIELYAAALDLVSDLCNNDKFGGATTYNCTGYWNNSNDITISEPVMVVESFATLDPYAFCISGPDKKTSNEVTLKIMFSDFIKAMRAAGQEAIAIVVNNEMFLL